MPLIAIMTARPCQYLFSVYQGLPIPHIVKLLHTKQVHQNQSGGLNTEASLETQRRTQTMKQAEVMIAPISLTVDTTMPLSAFDSSEFSEAGPTPSTCTVSCCTTFIFA